MPFIPPFGSPPGGAAGASLALDNLVSVQINTSLISDTDSTDDLGSASVFWREVFADKFTVASGSHIIPIGTTGIQIGGTGNIILGTASDNVTLNTSTNSFYPGSDSNVKFGRSDRFWDEAFTDELILSNVGAAAAAANTIRLAAVDLSAGNTMLDIDLEGTGAIFNSTDNTVTDKLAIGINGTTYYIMLTTSNA